MINETISQYLENTGTTERELAGKLGISPSHLNMIKKGTRSPSPRLAEKIEDLTGIPFRKLLLNKDTAA